MHKTIWAASALGLTILAMPAAAQEAPPAPAPAAAPAPPAGPEWRSFSRSATTVFLMDINAIVVEGDETRVKVARAPRNGAAGDLTHLIDEFALRCDANQSRMIASTDVFEDGAAGERFATDEPWESVRDGSFDDSVKQIACDGARPEGQPFASIAAYIDAGRP